MNEYLVELYSWLDTNYAYSGRYTFDDFQNNMQEDDFALEMYSWLTGVDKTFTEREPLDVWSEKVKVKKKVDLQDQLSAGVEEAMESEQNDGDSDSSQLNTNTNPLNNENPQNGTNQPEVDEPLAPEESALAQATIANQKTTESLINGQEVSEDKFNEFVDANNKINQQTEDPFTNSMRAVNQDLISGSEEQAVPLLNYHFNQYGFNFEPTDMMGDGMNVTSANGESLYVDLDNFFSSNDAEESAALQAFLEKNKADSRRLSLLENGYSDLERKIFDREDIDASVSVLNTQANLFNKQVQSWLQAKNSLDVEGAQFNNLTQEQLNQPGTRELYNNYIAARSQNNKERARIIARDNDLKTQGYTLDQTMGRYTEMQAKRGQLSGATLDNIWNGVGRQLSGAYSYIVDAAAFGGEYGGAGEKAFNRLYQDTALKMFGIRKQLDRIEGDEFDGYKMSLTEEQQKEVDTKTRDILAKQAKFDIYEWQEDGGAKIKELAGGGRYSDTAMATNISDVSSGSIVKTLRTAPEEVLGSASTTTEYSDLMKEGFWGGAYLGLMESLPAMAGAAGPAGWAQRTTAMFMQVSDHLNEEMFNDPDFENISEKEKLAIALPLGTVVAVLESVGLRNVVKQKGLMNKVLLKALGKYKGLRQVQGRGFQDVVRQEVDNMISRGVLTIAAGGVAEFETGAAQEIADISAKAIYNNIKDANMFQTPESFREGFNQVLKAGAQEMVGGWIMSVPGAMSNAAASKDFTRLDNGVFEVFEDMVGDGTSTKLIDVQLKNKINSGELTVKQAKEQQDIFNELKGVYNQIPSDYTTDQKKIALGLLLNKQKLEQSIAGKDPSSVKSIQDKIDDINTTLENIGRDALAATESPNLGRVEDEEKIITEEDAAVSLKEQGIENPTPEQIKTEQDALQKQSTESLDAQESSRSSEEVGQRVPDSQPTQQSQTETETQNREKTEEEIDPNEASDFEALVDPESKVESDIDNLPGRKQTVSNDKGVDVDIQVNEEGPNLSFTKKGKTEQENKFSNQVLKQAKNAAKAISKIFPNLKIVVHRDNEQYRKIDADNDNGMYQPKDNTIHINLSKANGRTVAHEIFHAVLLNKLKMNDKVAQVVTKKMVQALSRSKTLDKATRTELKKFIKNYDSEIQNEENLSEIVGMIADNYTSLDVSSKSVVRKWVEKIAAGLGIEIGQSEADVVELLNTIARKTKTGEQITEGDLKVIDDFKGGKKVENPADALARKSVGGFEVTYTQQESIADMMKAGLITQPQDISFMQGQEVTITAPDDMLAGEIKYNNKVIFEGEGGVFFVTKFGDVWASGKVGTANTIKNSLNKQLENNGGKAYLVLTKGTDAKLVSSASGVNSTLAILNTMLDNNLISPSMFRSAVSIAVKKAQGKINLRQSAKDLKTDIKKYFTNPNTSTFEKRGFVVKDIVGEIAKNLPKESQAAIAEFLGGDVNKNVGVGNTKKGVKGPGSQSLVDLIAKVAAEKLTKGLNVGDVYAAIEINSEVEVNEDSHPSYPFHISLKDGSKPVLHLFKNRQPGGEVLVQKSGKPYAVRNVSVVAGEVISPETEVSIESESKVEAPSVRKQKSDAEKLGLLFKMNLKGFMPNTIPLGELQRSARRLGLRVERAIYKEGYKKGQVAGYYFSDGVTQNGKPRFFNPRAGVRKQQSMGEIGRENKSPIDIIKIGRENNIKDNTIVDYLKRKTGLLMRDIKPLMKVSNFVLKNVPTVFGNISGGMTAGVKVFNKIYEFRKNLLDNNLTPTGKKISKLNEKIDEQKANLSQGDLFDAKKSEKIENKIKKLQQEIAVIQQKAKNTNKKFYKFTQQEIDNKTLDFLQSQPEYRAESNNGAYSTMQAQMTSQMMNAFEKGITKGDAYARIKAARKLIKGRSTADLKTTQRDLRNFIRQSLPSFVFVKPEVTKLINKVTNANTKNIENLKEEVLEFVNTRTNKELTKKINEILEGKYQDTQSGRKKGYKVSDEIRVRLENIKKEIGNVNSKTDVTEVEDMVQQLENRISKIESETFQNEKQRTDVADLRVVLNYFNAQLSPEVTVDKTQDLQDVINDLNSLVDQGKTEMEASLRAKHLHYVSNFEKAFYEITGTKVSLYIPNPEYNELQVESKSNPKEIKNPDSEQIIRDYEAISTARKKGVINRAKVKFSQLTEGMVAFVIGNNDLLNLMSKIGKMPGELFGGELQEMVTFKIDESTNDYKARKMTTTMLINAKLEEIYGTKKWRSKSQKDSIPAPTGILMSSGVEIEELSQNQMAYLVNQYRDPANEASYETKYGKDYKRVMEEMEALLNDEVKEIMKWQVEEFFPSLYEGYNEVYKKVYRTTMPWNEHYAGRIYREGTDSEVGGDVLSNEKGAYKGMASPASTKVRLKNKKAIKSMDQMAALMTYVNDMNYFAAFGENLNDVNNIFSNQDIRKAITNQYGIGPMKSIDTMIDTLSKKGVRSEYGMDWINNVTSAFVIGRLSINPTIFIKQLTSAPAYAVRIGFRNWMKYGTMKLPEMKSNWKEITDNSIYIQDRYGESILRTIESYAPGKVQTLVPSETMGDIVNVLMYLVKQGDKGAIVIGGVPNYAFYKDQYRKKNPTATNQEVIDYAIKMFERDTKTSQQSSDIQDKDQFQTGGAFNRSLNMFLTSVKQYLRKEMTTTRNLYRKIKSGGKEGKGTYWENFKTLAMYHSILPVVFQFISAGLPGVLAPWEEEDEETLLRAAALGNLNGLFIIGSFVEAFGDYLTAKPWTGQDESAVPILTIGLKFFRELNEANRFNVTPFDKNGKQRTAEAIQKSKAGKEAAIKKAFWNVSNAGLPLIQLDRLVKNADEILSGKASGTELIMRALQFSDYQILSKEERADAKKTTRKPKGKKLTNKELERYFPEQYEEKMRLQEEYKNSDMYRQKQEIKRQQKERREQMLDEMYN